MNDTHSSLHSLYPFLNSPSVVWGASEWNSGWGRTLCCSGPLRNSYLDRIEPVRDGGNPREKVEGIGWGVEIPESVIRCNSSYEEEGRKDRQGTGYTLVLRKYLPAHGEGFSQRHASKESCILTERTWLVTPAVCNHGLGWVRGSRLCLFSVPLLQQNMWGAHFYSCHRLACYFLIYCPSKIIV